MITYENTDWRHFTDQLTAQQVEDLTAMEQAWGSQPGGADQLVAQARQHVEGNRNDARFAHIPAPAAAVRVYHWQLHTDHGWRRAFEGRDWNLSGASVWIEGHQYVDCSATAQVFIETDSTVEPLNGDAARRLAAVLCEAAEEVDRCTGDAPPF